MDGLNGHKRVATFEEPAVDPYTSESNSNKANSRQNRRPPKPVRLNIKRLVDYELLTRQRRNFSQKQGQLPIAFNILITYSILAVLKIKTTIYIF